MAKRCRIVHVVYRFAVGGLENVIVQLINHLPTSEFEHIILSLTEISDFKNRLVPEDVRLIALDKPPGHAIPLYPKLFRLLRELAPDVLHTCNLAALEIVPIGWLAGIPLRIHAEHGWDAHDPNGSNAHYRRLRKLYRPFVSHYVAVSRDLDRYLADKVGVPSKRHSLVQNGVDTTMFSPGSGTNMLPLDCPFDRENHWLVGTVGRLQTVKNQPLLARAFVRLIRTNEAARQKMRLIIVGEGSLRAEIEAILAEAGCSQLAWLPGSRNDVASILQGLDCFVLPSEAEGTSCTLQEAMACGLPVIATAVGGTPELIEDGVNGLLVPSNDETSLAQAIASSFNNPVLAQKLGSAARQKAETCFSIDGMVIAYQKLFTSPA